MSEFETVYESPCGKKRCAVEWEWMDEDTVFIGNCDDCGKKFKMSPETVELEEEDDIDTEDFDDYE